MPAIFQPRANLFAKLVLAGLAALVCAGLACWWLWPRAADAGDVGVAVRQPVPFSHLQHAGTLGIDCRFCHASVEVSANAGMPPTATCMTCHSQIWTHTDQLATVRASLADDRPIVWNSVGRLPDYIHFNHAIHVAKGVGCASCHGPVERMTTTYLARSLSMRFCMSCHRDPGPNLRPRSAIFDGGWRRGPATPSVATLLAQYHVPDRNLTDCSICHR